MKKEEGEEEEKLKEEEREKGRKRCYGLGYDDIVICR